MKEALLIRHGQSHYNVKLTKNLNSELTPFGIKQAHDTGKFLKGHFPHIAEFTGVTSPYLRCLQTSAIIHEETGIDFSVHPDPREVMVTYDMCEVVNKKEKFSHFKWGHDGHLVFWRETEEEFLERIRRFVSSVNHEKLLVVSHGTPVTTMYEMFRGEPGSVDTIDYVRNCSISYVKDGEGIWLGKVVYE